MLLQLSLTLQRHAERRRCQDLPLHRAAQWQAGGRGYTQEVTSQHSLHSSPRRYISEKKRKEDEEEEEADGTWSAAGFCCRFLLPII